MKRIISILLILSMLAGLAACSNPEAEKDTSVTTASGASDTEAEVTTEDLSDNLPAKDFGGAELSMLIQTSSKDGYVADDIVGEVINDAVYYRNLTVEERFNVNMKVNDIDGSWDGMTGFMNAVRNSILSDDDAYSLVVPEYYYGMVLAAEGLFMNLASLEYIDLSRPWWTAGYNDQATIYGKLFAGVGSYSLSQLDNISILYFNKQLHDSYGFDDLYDLVKSGKWTFDKMKTMALAATKDLNGDGQITSTADQFGHMMITHGIRSFTTNFYIPFVATGDSGDPEIVFYNDKMLSTYDMIYSYVNENDGVLYIDQNKTNDMLTIFKENRSLFMTFTLNAALTLRDMEFDFGMIPMPKYDEEQENYRITPVGTDIFAIPITVNDVDMVSIVLEAMNAESYKQVVPVYYDTALKSKASRDEQSSEMLDLITESLYYDFGFINGSNLSYMADYFGNNIIGKVPNYASYWASNEKVYKKNLEKLLENYQNME